MDQTLIGILECCFSTLLTYPFLNMRLTTHRVVAPDVISSNLLSTVILPISRVAVFTANLRDAVSHSDIVSSKREVHLIIAYTVMRLRKPGRFHEIDYCELKMTTDESAVRLNWRWVRVLTGVGRADAAEIDARPTHSLSGITLAELGQRAEEQQFPHANERNPVTPRTAPSRRRRRRLLLSRDRRLLLIALLFDQLDPETCVRWRGWWVRLNHPLFHLNGLQGLC